MSASVRLVEMNLWGRPWGVSGGVGYSVVAISCRRFASAMILREFWWIPSMEAKRRRD